MVKYTTGTNGLETGSEKLQWCVPAIHVLIGKCRG